ncbi:hypothetical protein DSECCO2_611060 [anaerobic digester metagenome]
MPGGNRLQHGRGAVDAAKDHGHEHVQVAAFEQAAQQPVEPRNDLGRAEPACLERQEKPLAHGHEHGRRGPVAGDVGHEHVHARAVVPGFVEIPADLLLGLVHRGRCEPLEVQVLGQKLALHAAGQVAFPRKQGVLVAQFAAEQGELEVQRQPGRQFPGVVGLGHEIVGPGRQRLGPFAPVGLGRKQHDGHVAKPGQLPDAPRGLDAVGARHHEVEQNHVRAHLRRERHGFGPVLRLHGLVAERLGHVPLEQFAKQGVVVGDEHAGHGAA